jgi:hypothetical protein
VICLVGLMTIVMLGAPTETGGGLTGRVAATSDGVLPGVTVSLERMDGGPRLGSVTDLAGRYQFSALAPGSYRASFALQGFESRSIDVNVPIGSPRVLDVVLSFPEPTDQLIVSTCDPIIDVYSAEQRERPSRRYDVRVVDEKGRAVAWATFELSGKEHLSLTTDVDGRLCFMARTDQYDTFRIAHPAFLSLKGPMCALSPEHKLASRA